MCDPQQDVLHYVWAAAHRRTRCRSRSRFLPGKWHAHVQSNSPGPDCSAGLLCARGSAVGTHTRVSRAEKKQTQIDTVLHNITIGFNFNTAE